MQLIVNNITKSFGEKEVLRGISLNAHSGKALGLLGRNGAGKLPLSELLWGFSLQIVEKFLSMISQSTEMN